MLIERKIGGKIQLNKLLMSRRFWELRFKPPVDPIFREAVATIPAFNRGEAIATDKDFQDVIDRQARRYLELRDSGKRISRGLAEWAGAHTEEIVRVTPDNYYSFDFFPVDFD